MPNITLTLSQPISGVLQATPRNTFLAFGTNLLIVQQTYTATITGGNATLTLPRSDHANVTYLFEAYSTSNVDDYYYANGELYTSTDTSLSVTGKPFWQFTTGTGFNNQFYSGSQPPGNAAPTSDNKLLTKVTRIKKVQLFQPFDSLVYSSDANLATLINLGITTNQLDYSAYRVADLLTQAPFSQLLPKGITFKNSYNAATFYNKDEAVHYNGQLWIYISSSSLAGITPGTNDLVWGLGVDKGSPGGTGANSIGFNRTNWLSDTFKNDAVSRQDAVALYDAVGVPDLSNYARKDLANNFTGINKFLNPSVTPDSQEVVVVGWADSRYGRINTTNTWGATQTFNGSALVQNRSFGDNSQNAANTKFVQDALAAFTQARLSTPFAIAARAATQTFTRDTPANIVWDSFTITGGWDTGGGYAVPETGRYLIFLKIKLTLATTNFTSTDRAIVRTYWNRSSPSSVDVGDFFQLNTNGISTGASFTLTQDGVWFGSMTAGEIYSAQILFSGSAFNSGANAQSIGNGSGNNRIMIFRVS